MEFETNWENCKYHIIFGLRKGPEYLYRLFDVSRKQITREMKAFQGHVYIQQ